MVRNFIIIIIIITAILPGDGDDGGKLPTGQQRREERRKDCDDVVIPSASAELPGRLNDGSTTSAIRVTIGMKIPFSDSSGIADGSTLYS
jgi:hypothetical protein